MKGGLAVAAVVLAATAAISALLQVLRGASALVLPPQSSAAPRGEPSSMPDASLTALHDKRRRVLTHLREIQFDRDTGKLDEADYEALRAKYEAEAVAVLEAIDRLSPPPPQEPS